MGNAILSYVYFWDFNLPLEFWRTLGCLLQGECTLTLLVNQFRGSWILFQVGWWRGHSDLSLELNEGVLVAGWRSIQSNSHLSPYSLIPSSPFPHTYIWWHTCWSDYYALLRIIDAQALISDVWMCNIISIFSVSRNIRNTCMKGSHSP